MVGRTLPLLTCFAHPAVGEGLDDFVSGSVSVDYESKCFTYGLVDGDEPGLLTFGQLTFCRTLSAGALFIMDTTDYGERVGRGDRTWDFWEIDFPVDLRHVFTPDEFGWLPTSVKAGVGYRYEYHPPRTHVRDTQFWVADIALPDLWLVPRLAYERDTIRDNGTYLNFSLAHMFPILEGVNLTLTAGQGFGNEQRVGGYLPKRNGEPLDKAGLMDLSLRGELGWQVTDWMKVSLAVAYYDFPFDRKIREAARRYEPRNAGWRGSDTSWHFAGGLAVTFVF